MDELTPPIDWSRYAVDPCFQSSELYANGIAFDKQQEVRARVGQRKVEKTLELHTNGCWGHARKVTVIVPTLGFFSNLRVCFEREYLKGCYEPDDPMDYYQLLKCIELEVGGQRFDRMDSFEMLLDASLRSLCPVVHEDLVEIPIPIPLLSGESFFFSHQYHAIKINIEFAPMTKKIKEARDKLDTWNDLDGHLKLDYITFPDNRSGQFIRACGSEDWTSPMNNEVVVGSTDGPSTQILMMQSQFTGQETVLFDSRYRSSPRNYTDTWKIRLGFNHSLLYMGLTFSFGGEQIPEPYCHEIFSAIRLETNGEVVKQWAKADVLCFHGVFYLPLMTDDFMDTLDPHGVVVNAGQIDNSTMCIDFNKDFSERLEHLNTTQTTNKYEAEWLGSKTEVQVSDNKHPSIQIMVTARNYQLLRSMAGMAGMVYSK